MAERPTPIDYGAFQDPPSPLFRDYLTGAPAAAPFYAGGWSLETLVAAAERNLAGGPSREAMAGALERQQQARGAARAAQAARRLAEPGAVAVVSGQQAVLFGGPLFVLYKALAVQLLAARLEQERGRPAVPVFWVASDDHDFAEVRSTAVIDDAGQIRTLRYSPQREPAGQPASRVTLDESAVRLLEELDRALPPGPHRDAVLHAVGEAYRPGATLAGAFARLLSAQFPGLVVLDPGEPDLKALAAPVLARELAEASPTSRLALEVGERLLAAGYHQQVPVRAGFLNLFLLVDGERRALALRDGGIEVRGPGRLLRLEEALGLLELQPELWSPGALLRPLVQDFLLPTAAYVGGPAEIAYHAQIAPSYAHFGIPRPPLVPRPSLTLLEPAQARAIEAERLGFADLQAGADGLLSRWAREAYPDVDTAFSRARDAVQRELAAVEEALAALDPTLRAAADAARGRALHQVETLHEKAMRALKKRDQARADRLRRTRDALFPGGSFQERGLAWIGALAKHGPALVDLVRERMDLWARGHQVVSL